jgi:hypothetical protein
MSRQKDTAVNLAKFIDKNIIVKLAGGREGRFEFPDYPCFIFSFTPLITVTHILLHLFLQLLEP